jgi:hypothetical protein
MQVATVAKPTKNDKIFVKKHGEKSVVKLPLFVYN